MNCEWSEVFRNVFNDNSFFSKKGGFIKQLGVVTSIKIPSNPVQKYAEKENIQIHRWPLKDFENQKYDIGLVVSFGHLIPEDVINKFPL